MSDQENDDVGKRLLRSVSKKIIRQKTQLHNDFDDTMLNFSKYVHEAKVHEATVNKLLTEFDTLVSQAQNRRSGKTKSKTNTEEKTKKVETVQKEVPKRKQDDIARNEVIKHNLLNKINYYKEDKAQHKLLKKKVAKFKNQQSGGTHHIEHNKKIIPNFVKYTKKQHQIALEKELKKRKKAMDFRIEQHKFEEHEQESRYIEKLERLKQEDKKKNAVEARRIAARKKRMINRWEKLIKKTKTLQFKNTLKQLKLETIRVVKSSIAIQRFWRKYKADHVNNEKEEMKTKENNKIATKIMKELSYEGKVKKLQNWWRAKLIKRARIISKITYQWKRVEYLLIKEEETFEQFRGNKHATIRSPKHNQHKQPRSPILKKLNSHGMLKSPPPNCKKICKEKRSAIIMELYLDHRKQFRQILKEYHKEMAIYKKQNTLNLQMNEMRKSLGLSPDPRYKQEFKPMPQFEINLTDHDLTKIILDTRKHITMKKLQDIQNNGCLVGIKSPI